MRFGVDRPLKIGHPYSTPSTRRDLLHHTVAICLALYRIPSLTVRMAVNEQVISILCTREVLGARGPEAYLSDHQRCPFHTAYVTVLTQSRRRKKGLRMAESNSPVNSTPEYILDIFLRCCTSGQYWSYCAAFVRLEALWWVRTVFDFWLSHAAEHAYRTK